MLPAMQEFIEKMRGLCAATGDDAERFEKARPYLQELLEDPVLRERAEIWPSRNDPGKGLLREPAVLRGSRLTASSSTR